jgi:hypothetical protein
VCWVDVFPLRWIGYNDLNSLETLRPLLAGGHLDPMGSRFGSLTELEDG